MLHRLPRINAGFAACQLVSPSQFSVARRVLRFRPRSPGTKPNRFFEAQIIRIYRDQDGIQMRELDLPFVTMMAEFSTVRGAN